jgi:anti-sigma B factor antagonist
VRITSTEVTTREVGKTLIIDVRGKVDLFSSPKMRSAILEAIGNKGISQVSINLSQVTYLDSSGVATLVEGLQRARARPCRFVLFGLQDAAREVLKLARLDKIFEIRATEADALEK